MPWKPVLNPGIDLRGLPLTPEEGFVASRLDGITDLHGLSVVTGLSPERIDAALERLVSPRAGSPPQGPDAGEPAGTGEDAAPPPPLYATGLHHPPPHERTPPAR